MLGLRARRSFLLQVLWPVDRGPFKIRACRKRQGSVISHLGLCQGFKISLDDVEAHGLLGCKGYSVDGAAGLALKAGCG